MQSIVSLMSVNNNSDIAPLDDLEDIPDLESYGDISEHVLDFTAQLEQLTNSLTNSELATPMSGKRFYNNFLTQNDDFNILLTNKITIYSSIVNGRSNTFGGKSNISRF